MPRVAAHLTANRKSALVSQSKRHCYLAKNGEMYKRSGELFIWQCSVTDCTHLRLLGTSFLLFGLMIIMQLQLEVAGNGKCLSLRRKECMFLPPFNVVYYTVPENLHHKKKNPSPAFNCGCSSYFKTPTKA